MPVFISVAILMFSIIILFLGLLLEPFQDWKVTDQIAVLSSFITTAAFCATAWNAYEARKSAKAALEAVRITTDSLIEMRKNSFKEWFDTSLNQHDELYNNVIPIIEQTKKQFNKNEMHSFFYPLVRKHEVIQYIKHITNILVYVDNRFYIDGNCFDEKMEYIIQLSGKIPPQMKLVIAVFGLDIDSREPLDSKKLYALLNKYDFFKDEIFFDDAYSSMPEVELFIKDRFDKIFKTKMLKYFWNVIKEYYSQVEVKEIWVARRPQVASSVLMNYQTPLSGLIDDYFKNLPNEVKSIFDEALKKANDSVTSIDDYIHRLIGCRVASISEHVHFESEILSSEKDVKDMIKNYIEQRKTGKNAVNLGQLYFSSESDVITGDQLSDAIDEYEKKLALMAINDNDDSDNLLCHIYIKSCEIVDEYKRETLKLGEYAQ